MAVAIKQITQRHQLHWKWAQHINSQLPVADQVGVIVRHYLQEQNAITTIKLVIDRKVKRVKTA